MNSKSAYDKNKMIDIMEKIDDKVRESIWI